MLITKQDGSQEEFDPHKLDESLLRAGTSKEAREEIIERITDEIEEGMSTTVIYRKAYKLLEKYEKRPEVTFRYSLRRAIADFGPSGFPFEKFIGEVYRLEGYQVEVGKKIKGRCATHELDIVGHKEGEIFTAELKFHNKQSIRTDLQTTLYMRARFDDLIAINYYKDTTPRLAIITNTKFTSSAINYGECMGIELIGWNFPRREGNLHDVIMKSGIHPLTCLSSLSKSQKRYFLEKGLVLCRELVENDMQALREARGIVPESKLGKIREEIELIQQAV
ncbi:MAG: ATP cone domain-containing protein [Patescibacteria group bacterium]